MGKFDNKTLRVLLFIVVFLLDIYLVRAFFQFEPILSLVWLFLSIYWYSIFPYKKWFKMKQDEETTG